MRLGVIVKKRDREREREREREKSSSFTRSPTGNVLGTTYHKL
jgi:hypothetical protein